ncbi:hypothetical protein AN916_08310 [Mycobacteroides immunogenum]|nr:hypothetical protein AN916_08310 [Mycobacteroides immunogenum]
MEFSGVFTEEYCIYEATTFLVTIDIGHDRAQFEVLAEFGKADWQLAVRVSSMQSNIPVVVRFDQTDSPGFDPMIVFEFDDDAKVRVIKVGGEDDED